MTNKELIAALMAANLSPEELTNLTDVVRFKQQQRTRQVVRTVAIGSMVEFEGRGGVQVIGKVVKVNNKTLIVNGNDGIRWRVSATLCKLHFPKAATG